ncbi:MAG TPA: hypothetical protein ENN28_02420 [Candidatus Uhrbacteria bacterium]|nr:hypothetical protein [Candidatus Uhrbacteria bacterium]
MLKINFKDNKILPAVVRDLFLAGFVLLVIFSFLELFKPRIVTNYLNLDIFLFFLLLLGAVAIMHQRQEKKKIKKLNFLDYSTICLFSVLVGILIFYLTRTTGIFSFLIGLAGVVICYFFIRETMEY